HLGEMDRVITLWQPKVPAGQKQAFDALVARAQEFKAFRIETARLGTEVSPAAANEQGNNEANRANRKAFQKEIDAVVEVDKAALAQVEESLETFQSWIMALLATTVAFGVAAGAGLGVYIARSQLSRPI